MRRYEEHHFLKVEDVGVAFNHDRIWVCINGAALLRAKVMVGDKLFIEYYDLSQLGINEASSIVEKETNDP